MVAWIYSTTLTSMCCNDQHNTSSPSYILYVSAACCFGSIVLSAGCKKQAAHSQLHELRDVRSNGSLAETSTQANAHLSEADRVALQTLLMQPLTARETEARASAAKLLGEHRCVAAVPTLIDNLNVIHWPEPRTHDLSREFPAAAALVAIGEPAVPQITKHFEETNSRVKELLLLDTLMQVKGKAWTVQYLKRLQAERKRPKKDLPRLTQLIEYVSSFPR